MKVSNPLTIIAIFAGLAETLATVALVKLPPEIQSTFVYFVMFFPTIIVSLFFWVLYFKNTVLYAPSDFSNQSHYLEANLIKEDINEKVSEIFNRLNTKGVSLTQEEIDNAKADIEKSVDDATTLSLRERITEFLTDNPSTSAQVGKHVDIASQDALSILSSMKRKGTLVNHKEHGAKRFTWSLNV